MTLPNSYQNDLKNNICSVKFTKTDGSIRVMDCTLREDVVPPSPLFPGEEKKQKKANPDVVAVWSLGDNAWRSFRKDSVIDFIIIE
jgi:WYL_2, Sm-like SH3 beta-barrel fold